jgi:hypothetical protein
MKKHLLAFFLLFAGVNVNSQVLMTLIFGDMLNSDKLEFGLEGGANFSKITGLETNKFFVDWNLGFYFDIVLKEDTPWDLVTGVLVKARQGAGKLTENDVISLRGTMYDENGKYNQKINYFLIPVMAKYKFNKNIYIEAGTQLGLMYKAYVEYLSDVPGREAVIKDFNKDLFHRIDAGVIGGAGYRLNGRTGWTFGLKYYYGLTNVIKDTPGTRNQSVFLKVYIPIGRSERAQQKNEEKRKKKAKKKAERERKKEDRKK